MPSSFPFSFLHEALLTPRSPSSDGFLPSSCAFLTPVLLAPASSSPSSHPFCSPRLLSYIKAPGIPPQKAWLKNLLGGSWLLAFLRMLSTQQLYGCQGAISVPLGQNHNQPGRAVPPPLLPGALSGFHSHPQPQPITAQFIYGGPAAPVSFHLNYLHIQGD